MYWEYEKLISCWRTAKFSSAWWRTETTGKFSRSGERTYVLMFIFLRQSSLLEDGNRPISCLGDNCFLMLRHRLSSCCEYMDSAFRIFLRILQVWMTFPLTRLLFCLPWSFILDLFLQVHSPEVFILIFMHMYVSNNNENLIIYFNFLSGCFGVFNTFECVWSQSFVHVLYISSLSGYFA